MKKLKTYEQYLTDYLLSEEFDTETVTDSKIKQIYSKQYQILFAEQKLMRDVADNFVNESFEDAILAIHSGNWEHDANEFFNSYKACKRIEFLTPYTVEDLKEFYLFKASGYNIGFAIKPDGELILVHNNEPEVKGVGDLLIKQAVKNGAKKLDHFDGFLTGFYKKNGFRLSNHDIFADEFAPKNWHYKKVDINNPKKSIYADELNPTKDQFINAKIRYDNGKPDIVYRKK